MKFKQGNKVEVLRRKKDLFGSWYPGKIISVDGDHYTVRYEAFLNHEGKPVVEKVYAKGVRPQPPSMKGGEQWAVGDTVEVLDVHSWKPGKIAKVMNNNRFVIRMFGSIQLREFDRNTLRVWQVWRNNKWALSGKVDGTKQIDTKVVQICSKYSHGLGGGEWEEFKTFIPGRTLKRKHNCCYESSHYDAVCQGGGKKEKPVIKIEGCDGLPMRTLPFPKQVDAFSSQNFKMGKKCVNGSFEMDVKTDKTNNYVLHPSAMPVQVTEESKQCSASSCSSNDHQEFTAQNFQQSSGKIAFSSSSDVCSSCPSMTRLKGLPFCVKEELEANIHKLELHAYKSTMQALYASGPLSWEQEYLLTNLRLSLHISNEEHLNQLRYLLS
ncbi:PREDICTED: uncharacterized protein LOC104609591 [Nelumbo nucifera]|uniref:Uncharacterized protein LOC104609591 n=2 Tax=Nelumbo nucifera TaxID=4432 RepID=A0A1U8B4F4_NELNU|nr:PREDICTED: uncharacterized protein LOC104609591 [Nelumbo nucifera]XP_010274253.1 PREDICTED: uncharacterized protein LOC104609591 [Nelumbo nucifera]XP_010274254.1 PREDICTED: uncharacterized protein LOC104609591 [Nelumbo nucifera]XP_010274255.1 PREDICTED: uncharacterized protein LOC104609591 [Nelumbo nucifera]XP_010274256.1 PREDICTED: uncharacterized protein LOC104609591 [Nelumbo nucifera]XP_010274257.1 PREDICTED: uncharacterized protein LOC104609591 [Nelumbo nucifera]XP_010274258.1 PREDICTE